MADVPTSYTDALDLFNERLARGILRRGVKLANNTYLTYPEPAVGGPDWFGVKLHATEVVKFYRNGDIVLDSGGWLTFTTKERMNRAVSSYYNDASWRVWSDRGVWYVGTGNYSAGTHKHFAYADGMTLHPDGTVTGEGEDPNKQRKLRKRVKEYAKAYTEALYAGEIESPGLGDCVMCLLVKDGKPAMGGPDHILSHIEESYFVPSLLARRLDDPMSGLSRAAKHTICCFLWPDQAPAGTNPYGGIVKDQVEKAVRKQCFVELGMAR